MGGASEAAIILLSMHLHLKLKILIYPACQGRKKEN